MPAASACLCLAALLLLACGPGPAGAADRRDQKDAQGAMKRAGMDASLAKFTNRDCSQILACDACTLVANCGWCERTAVSGDGKATLSVPQCMKGNVTGPTEPAVAGVRCDTWSMESCPCPKSCSMNGECVEGECFCYPKFMGEDCSITTPVRGHGSWEGGGGARREEREVSSNPASRVSILSLH